MRTIGYQGTRTSENGVCSIHISIPEGGTRAERIIRRVYMINTTIGSIWKFFAVIQIASGLHVKDVDRYC